MSNAKTAFRVAREEGRVCSRCGWIITKKNWAKGYRLCAGCHDALKGVNVNGRYGKWFDEPQDRTGEMP
jgi:hypothetical protein